MKFCLPLSNKIFEVTLTCKTIFGQWRQRKKIGCYSKLKPAWPDNLPLKKKKIHLKSEEMVGALIRDIRVLESK